MKPILGIAIFLSLIWAGESSPAAQMPIGRWAAQPSILSFISARHGGVATGACSFSPGTQVADGCSGAQSTGSVQQANYFSGYTGKTYTNRPSWNVAAVDYPVGYAGSLADGSVSGNLPACATVNATGGSGGGPLVTVNSAPCTLQGLDFSLHNGVCVFIAAGISNGAQVLLKNDKFATGTNCTPTGSGVVNVSNTGSNIALLIQFCEFDNLIGTSTTAGAYVQAVLTGGSVTIQYTAMLQCPNGCISNAAASGTEAWTLQYNYMKDYGYATGSHGNWDVSTTTAATFSFVNTYNVLYADSSSPV